MWDFNMGQALGAMIKTAPFIIFRIIIYVGIALAYVLAVGVGAGIGYGLGSIGDEPGGWAFGGGFIGFGIVSVALYWAREYLLYLVKAGHVAVLVEHLDGKALPGGRGQIEYAQAVVKERFAEVSVLFGVQNAGGEAGHLGGAIAGFYLIRNTDKLHGFFDFLGRVDPTSHHYRGPRAIRRGATTPRHEVDRILDKISADGLHSLTEREKRVLREASEK